MSEAMTLWVAIITGVFVFAILNKYLQQLSNALMGGILVGVLVYLLFPQGPKADQQVLNDTAQKAGQNLKELQNNRDVQFKTIDELKKEIGSTDQASQDRMNELDKILAD